MPLETDIFENLDAIRLPQGGAVHLVEIATRLRVRKPGRLEFVKTDPRPALQICTGCRYNPNAYRDRACRANSGTPSTQLPNKRRYDAQSGARHPGIEEAHGHLP